MAGNWPEAQADWVSVPAPWNITHPDAEGVGFYRKIFTLPANWIGRAIQLHFDGASYRADVWLNGKYIGSHEGAYTPFWFDATQAARVGSENELIVRVAALSRTEDVDGMVLQQSPASKQSWYYVYGGLWGNVYLQAVPLLSCQAVVIEPDLGREIVLVDVAINNRHVECQPVDLHMQVVQANGHVAAERHSSVSTPPGTARFAYRIALPRPLAWSCENPNLYQLRVEVTGPGDVQDRLATTFGMRDFTVQNGQFFLNEEPILLRGVLLQPNYPINLVTPPDRDMMVREIELVKEAGFNLIRAHIRPAPPGYLDLTDQMGVLVYAETSLAWIKDSPRLLDHGRRELQAMIERDRNHPSVVFWGIHNENRAASALTSEALIRHTRALDATRVIVDNSGGTMAIDQDFGWVDRATVVPNRETMRQIIQDLHIYVGAPIPSPVYEWMRSLGISDPPVDIVTQGFGSPAMLDEFYRGLRSYGGKVFVSELGCGGMADLDDMVAGFQGQEHLLDACEIKTFRDSLHQGFQRYQLDRVFGSVQTLVREAQELQAAGNTRQVEALLVNPRVSGYIITQLNDVAWEFHAGIMDLWRNPKPAYDALKRLNQPDCVILKAATPVVTCGERVDVNLTLIQRGSRTGAQRLMVSAYDPTGKDLATQELDVPPGTGIKPLGTLPIEMAQSSGRYRMSARLFEDGQMLAESSEVILALPPADLATLPVDVDWVGRTPGWLDKERAVKRPSESVARPRVIAAAIPGSLTQDDWENLFEAVETGHLAIIGPLQKRDELALCTLANRGVDVQLHFGIGNWMGCYHWIPDSDLFAGLPAGGLAGEVYVEVLPRYVMSELGGHVFAGSLRNTQTRLEPAAMLWYSDIELLRLGEGGLLLCQYRVFERADTNPLSRGLLLNLLRLAIKLE